MFIPDGITTESWIDLIFKGIVSFGLMIVGLGAFFKAIKEIRENGWRECIRLVVSPFRKRREERLEMKASIIELKGDVKTLVSEMRTNGNESIRDAVDSIGAQVANLDDKVENIIAHTRNQDEISEKPIFHLDTDRRMTYSNYAFRDLIGADESDLQHRNWLSLIRSEDRTRLISELAQAVENAMPLDAVVVFMNGPCVRLQVNPHVRSGGSVTRFFGTATKIEKADIHTSQAG